MDKLLLAGGCALVALLAAAKLIQLLQWRRCEAVVLRRSAFGREVPVVFRLQDGTEATASLRHFGRGSAPEEGERLGILHDPRSPGSVEWPAAIPVVGLILGLLCAAFVSLLFGGLRDSFLF